jgi:putative phosphoesterase
MKIGLFSDIHANLPALEALFEDMDNRKPDAVYCLGDLIGYNVWPNEVIAAIRTRGIATVAGNHDLKVKGFAYDLVTAENRAYLNTLPAHIKLEYGSLNIVLAHGSTRSINEYVVEDLEESYVLGMMTEANANVLCIGHSHLPYHRIIGDKHVINIGSVGKPKDGNADGCYVMLTIEDSIQVEFVRFAYDIEKAAMAILQSPLPDELADRIRKAY